MSYLIVGLGNVGSDYEGTRHNIGFDVVDDFVKDHGLSWEQEKYGDIANGKMKGKTFHVLKPSLYMNRSGKSVVYWKQKLKIPDENLLVVHDELHLDLGTVRLRKKGNAAGHNGIQDIIDKLGTENFCRIKVGIGSEFPKGRQVDFVLGQWDAKERDLLIEVIPHCTKMINSFIAVGPERTMSDYNKKVIK